MYSILKCTKYECKLFWSVDLQTIKTQVVFKVIWRGGLVFSYFYAFRSYYVFTLLLFFLLLFSVRCTNKFKYYYFNQYLQHFFKYCSLEHVAKGKSI